MRPAWLLIALVGLASLTGADEPPKRLQVVVFKDDGVNIVGMNSRGEVVGFELTERKEHPGVLEESAVLPPREDGHVFASAQGLHGHVPRRGQRRWDGGGAPASRDRSLARGSCCGTRRLSGTRTTASRAWESGGRLGVVRLRGQPRWEADQRVLRRRQPDSAGASGTATAATSGGRARSCRTSLGLTSQTVPISDNGKFVAAVDGTVPCLWTRDDLGRWTREVIGGGGSLVPRGVNNSGIVVGLRARDRGLHARGHLVGVGRASKRSPSPKATSVRRPTP